MAAKYWPGKDPFGQRLKMKDSWLQIVGIAKKVNYEQTRATEVLLLRAACDRTFLQSNNLLIRTRETPGVILTALAHEVHALDPTLAPTAPFRVQEQVDRKGYTQRLAATLIANFRRDGAFSCRDWTLCRDVLLGFAGHTRVRIENGTRRTAICCG